MQNTASGSGPFIGNACGIKRLVRFTLCGQKKWMGNGSCIAWCTILKSWRIVVMQHEKEQGGKPPN